MDPDFLARSSIECHQRIAFCQHIHDVVDDERVELVHIFVRRGIRPGYFELVYIGLGYLILYKILRLIRPATEIPPCFVGIRPGLFLLSRGTLPGQGMAPDHHGDQQCVSENQPVVIGYK